METEGEGKTRVDDKKRGGGSENVESINRSVSQARTNLFQFHPRMRGISATTAINQSVETPQADLQFGLHSLFRIFTHRVQIRSLVRRPRSLGIFLNLEMGSLGL